ncbi:MAG: misacylated tRNA(Ala) deacylase [Thermoplasmata archaeon]|jgi:misacylated tRNA(Ala) deacylase|nr:misacylated tRNA(Ala) deacylase [Thermoplasmata archaeon]
MTRLLYMDALEACYARAFEATVMEAKPDAVILDQSLFYPLGGGQEWDTGTLMTPDGRTARVVEVTKRGPVRHTIGLGHGLVAGDKVAGAIDWDRRYAHMRMHTAQHLVSGLAYEMFGGPRTVGNQIHADRSRIDFNPVNFTNEMLRDLETAANDAIRAQHKVTLATMTRDQVLAEQPPERTNMDLLPKSVTELRVIRIGADVDLCPCAGTHVQNTKEIGEVRIVARSSKGSGTQRIEYVLEQPA